MPQKMQPQWQQTWDNRSEEIDQHIADCCSQPNQRLEDVSDKVRTKVNGYLQEEGQEPIGQFGQNDPQGQEFQQRVNDRIRNLERDGRINKQNVPTNTR